MSISLMSLSSASLPDPNNPFHRLPDELLSRILGKLEEADLGRVSAVRIPHQALHTYSEDTQCTTYMTADAQHSRAIPPPAGESKVAAASVRPRSVATDESALVPLVP